jgi:D-glycero-D-manno-heptose 1,7-bisphosphate phosphatase
MGKSKALFLDRDGVINVERCYVHSQENFHFHEGIFELCRAAQDLGYLLVVITNQAGIARGYYTETEFLELTGWMTREFASRQVQVASVYYCPYHPMHGLGKYKRDSPDRKPNPGMLLKAQAELDLDLGSSIMIGDSLSDMYAAQKAGVETTILFRAGGISERGLEDTRYHLSDSLHDIRQRFFSKSPLYSNLKKTCE